MFSSGKNMSAIFELLDRIESVINGAGTRAPLVIHGGSGIAAATRRDLSMTSNICKFNVGTELRVVFGNTLRKVLAEHPEEFDRVAILGKVIPDLREATRGVLRSLDSQSRA